MESAPGIRHTHPTPESAGWPASAQHLEDIATAYWYSETLFTAVEMEIFHILEPAGKTAAEAAKLANCDYRAMERFLQALAVLGLLTQEGSLFSNTGLAAEYLVRGEKHYQGDSILWRKQLAVPWRDLTACLRAGGRVAFPPAQEDAALLAERTRRYIAAMDNVAQAKAVEIVPVFRGLDLQGELLDAGAGSGALAAGFLEYFPAMRATLLDLPPVLTYTAELLKTRDIDERVTYKEANLLSEWPVNKNHYELVIVSNLLHTYAEDEAAHILAAATGCLRAGGLLVVHDFFPEHRPHKAALFDLNMLINTYDGRVLPAQWIQAELASLGLGGTKFIPLPTDTALIVAARDKSCLAKLHPQVLTGNTAYIYHSCPGKTPIANNAGGEKRQGEAPMTKNEMSSAHSSGKTPINQNVAVVAGANRSPLGATYQRRAKQLVKKGRAEWVDDNTIRIFSEPSAEMRADKMTENTEHPVAPDWVAYIKNLGERLLENDAVALAAISTIKEGSFASPSDSPGNAIGRIVEAHQKAKADIFHRLTKYVAMASGDAVSSREMFDYVKTLLTQLADNRREAEAAFAAVAEMEDADPDDRVETVKDIATGMYRTKMEILTRLESLIKLLVEKE